MILAIFDVFIQKTMGDFFHFIIDFILHIDRHLVEIVIAVPELDLFTVVRYYIC